MIKIEIVDPSMSTPAELRAVANMLLTLAGDVPGTVTKTETKTVGPLSITKIETAPASFTIAPNDNPEVGMNAVHDFETEPDPAAIFGKGAPPVPNVPPVPAAHVSAPVSGTNPALELDITGIPWDARIHSSNHEKNKSDGKWRAKRGVDAAYMATVEAELRGVMALPAVPPVPPAPPVAIATVPVSSVGHVPAPPPPAIVVGATSLTLAAPSIAPSGMTFAQLLPKVVSGTAAGTITQAQVVAACEAVGLPSLPSLALKQEYVQTVHDLIFPPVPA